MEQCAVEQQLHVVFLLLAHMSVHRPHRRLAAFLFYNDVETEMYEVHTSLQTEHGAYKRRLQHYLVGSHGAVVAFVH